MLLHGEWPSTRRSRWTSRARDPPKEDIIAWRQTAPWADDALVEQDLVLSRALVDIFGDRALGEALALRGGTALHKLILTPPHRYSEDIDLVQVASGPIGSIIDGLRARLDGWLGEPRRDHADGTVTLLYRLNSEIPPTRPLRLKVEINTREHFSVFGHVTKPFAVQSRWFEARARIRTYSVDELLATKLRALYQRRRGRDLFDLWDALTRATVDPERVIEAFRAYLERGGARISRAEFERNFARKAHDRAFLDEGRALLAADVEYDPREAVELIRRELIQRLPGEPWKGR